MKPCVHGLLLASVLLTMRSLSNSQTGPQVIPIWDGVAPGGGFRVLSYANEGLRVAKWFADRGVTAFVPKS